MLLMRTGLCIDVADIARCIFQLLSLAYRFGSEEVLIIDINVKGSVGLCQTLNDTPRCDSPMAEWSVAQSVTAVCTLLCHPYLQW